MVLNSFNFCLSEKLLISPSILNEILAKYCNLGCIFSPFSTSNISCHSLLGCRVSAERSAVKHMRFPLYVTCCFSLVAFNILSLCFIFVSLISMCLGVFLLSFSKFLSQIVTLECSDLGQRSQAGLQQRPRGQEERVP